MRIFLSLVISVALLAGCVLFPDAVSVGVRTGDRTGIQGLTLTALYNNPWKPRRVVQEQWLIPCEGQPGGEND